MKTYQMIGLIFIGILILGVIEYCFLTNVNFHKMWNPNYYNDLTFDLQLGKEGHQTKTQQLVVNQIARGKRLAKNQSVVITGLARNIADQLRINIPKIELIGNLFKSYQIIIFENDSTDGTRELIKEWSQLNSNVTLLECCDLGDCNCNLKEKVLYDLGAFSSSRIDKMGFFRNRYLEYVKQNFKTSDYLMVVDLDIEGSMSMDGVLNSIGQHNSWDMVCMNGRAPIPATIGLGTVAYDCLAYKSKDNRSQNDTNWMEQAKNWFQMNWQILKSESSLLPVSSAFNGAAIYKIKSLMNPQIKYQTISNSEHIGLHEAMIASGHGRIFINPIWKGYVGFQGPRSNLLSYFR